MTVPRVVIAAPSSNAGKTSVATGLVAALAGNVVGTRLRPLFGLEVEKTPRETAC